MKGISAGQLLDKPDTKLHTEKVPEGCITIDPGIGVFLKADGMNIVDFLERRRAEIEGLILGAGALIEIDRLACGWDTLTEAAGAAAGAVAPLGPIRLGDQEVAREMLASARLALMDFYSAASTVAELYRSQKTKSQ